MFFKCLFYAGYLMVIDSYRGRSMCASLIKNASTLNIGHPIS